MKKKHYVSFDEDLVESLHDPEFRKEWDALSSEYALLHALFDLRQKTKLTQRDLAKKMKASQSEIARLERGHNATFKTLQRIADATGTKLKIEFV